jgi:peptidyl-prolyl cis-trans isomerase B (cyclophilin B)
MGIYTPLYQPNGNEVAVIETNKGSIKVKLAGKEAPIHVGNFVELARKGFYNGLKFHRHEPNFVIQGGCPHTRDLSAEQVRAGGGYPSPGTGNPGYSIKGEWMVNPNNKHRDGTLAMARSQHPDSAGSQFYFCLGPQAFLDGNYTVFGDPVDQASVDVIHALAKGDEILSIEIENGD